MDTCMNLKIQCWSDSWIIQSFQYSILLQNLITFGGSLCLLVALLCICSSPCLIGLLPCPSWFPQRFCLVGIGCRPASTGNPDQWKAGTWLIKLHFWLYPPIKNKNRIEIQGLKKCLNVTRFFILFSVSVHFHLHLIMTKCKKG